MKKLLLIGVILTGALDAYCQRSLDKSWESLMNKGESYQNYKVIKKADLENIWTTVKDSVYYLQTNLAAEKSKVLKKEEEITALKKQVAEVSTNLSDMDKEKDNISFMGGGINKYVYVCILWVLLVAAVAACGLMLFLYTRSNKITLQKKKDYNDIFASFEEHKASKIEVERKLKREMQNYINKITDLEKKR